MIKRYLKFKFFWSSNADSKRDSWLYECHGFTFQCHMMLSVYHFILYFGELGPSEDVLTQI